MALIELTDSLYLHIDNRDAIIGMYFDLQKAFDTVNHDILLCKLQKYGIRGIVLDWFRDYLHNRKQFVSVGDIESDLGMISCGVPQGSVLGPLLFLIYVNDICNIGPECNVRLFADDTNVFVFGKTMSDVFLKSNTIVAELNNWFIANKLSLNVDKTCYSVFGNRSDDGCLSNVVKLNDISLTKVDSCKYLGVIIDSELTWKMHIDYVYSKLLKFTSIFYKLRYKVSPPILRMLYFAFVHTQLLYGIE